MQPGSEIREFHEIDEVVQPAISAAVLEVRDERRTVGWREHRVLAANAYTAERVTGMLDELPRRRSAHDLACKSCGNVHTPLVLDASPCGVPQPYGFGVATHLEPYFLENLVRVSLDGYESLLREKLIRRNVAGNVCGSPRTFRALDLAGVSGAWAHAPRDV